MLKNLMYVAFIALFTFLFFLSKNALSPTFQLTNSPTILTKGHYGETFIVEISYSHEGLEEWLTQLPKPYPLILADVNWLSRSEELTKLLIEKHIPVGLLGQESEQYKNPSLLTQELKQFQNIFGQMPLWFATQDDVIDTALVQTLFQKQINVLSPANMYPDVPTKGDFIALRLHRHTEIDFQNVTDYMKSHRFLSIEESLFGYTISTKRVP